MDKLKYTLHHQMTNKSVLNKISLTIKKATKTLNNQLELNSPILNLHGRKSNFTIIKRKDCLQIKSLHKLKNDSNHASFQPN